LLTSFSGGAILVLSFVLLDESKEILTGTNIGEWVAFLWAGSVLVYLLFERMAPHSHFSEDEENHDHSHNREKKHDQGKPIFRNTLLSVHSAIDGLAIAISFQASLTLGLITSVAVLAHKISDGFNATVFSFSGGSTNWKRFVFWNATATVFGYILGQLIEIKEIWFGGILALMAGIFMFISMSELIPESFHKHPTRLTTTFTILGALFLGIIVFISKSVGLG